MRGSGAQGMDCGASYAPRCRAGVLWLGKERGFQFFTAIFMPKKFAGFDRK